MYHQYITHYHLCCASYNFFFFSFCSPSSFLSFLISFSSLLYSEMMLPYFLPIKQVRYECLLMLTCLFACLIVNIFVYSFVNRQGIVLCQQKYLNLQPHNQLPQFLKASYFAHFHLYIRATHNDSNFILVIFLPSLLQVVCETNFSNCTCSSLACTLCRNDKVFITR